MQNEELFEGDILGFAPAIALSMDFVGKTHNTILNDEGKDYYSTIFNRPVS